MIALDSPEWKKLHHAYGEAVDIPPLLRQLSDYLDATNYEAEPYFSLWSALCHQGDTCTAAYASVPHIIEVARRNPKRINYQFVLLPVSVELARLNRRGPEIPSNHELAYFKAVRSIPVLIASLSSSQLDETMALTCAAAIPIQAGHSAISEAILELGVIVKSGV